MGTGIEISEYREMERFIRDGRWYIRLEANGTKKTMPHANYIWLLHNPSFDSIPESYVIHHLDLDSFNDDPSNLVLMLKYHHIAYHIKTKTRRIEVSVDYGSENLIPIHSPTITRKSGRDYWVIRYTVRDRNGSAVRKYVSNSGEFGHVFKTKDEASEYVKKLWPFATWENTA